MPKTKPISQRAYARHRGCSAPSVQQAIAEGRLSKSLIKVKGVAKIKSLKAADKEWAANTGPTASARVDTAKKQRGLPDDKIDFAEAKRRRAIEDLKVARNNAEHHALDLAERAGDLISAKQAREDVANDYAHVRTKMLGVSARCKQRIPGITNNGIKIIDDLIREALEELAGKNVESE